MRTLSIGMEGEAVARLKAQLSRLAPHLGLRPLRPSGDEFDADLERLVIDFQRYAITRGYLKPGDDDGLFGKSSAYALRELSEENLIDYGSPVLGLSQVTSPYGFRDLDLYGSTKNHLALDIGARELNSFGVIDKKTNHKKNPTYIIASADGVVDFAAPHGGHGNSVWIDHKGHNETRYAHMSKILVTDGQHVKKGQIIGVMGSLGVSTGPHLHYEQWRNGQPIEPLIEGKRMPADTVLIGHPMPQPLAQNHYQSGPPMNVKVLTAHPIERLAQDASKGITAISTYISNEFSQFAKNPYEYTSKAVSKAMR